MAQPTTRGAGKKPRARSLPERRSAWIVPLVISMIVVATLGGWYLLQRRQLSAGTPHKHSAGVADHEHGAINIPHVHGLGFSADGQQLFVPAHTGFRIFADGQWLTPKLPVNDYMGYAATDDGFYSSGHPGPTSRLPNPVGLIKSTDGGKTFVTLGFAGETDFHTIGAGYKSHAIYLVNPAPNSRLSAGLHYSVDEGKTWQTSAARGLTAEPIQLAVHPTDASLVAAATEGGLYLSSDYGDTFERIGSATLVTSATFSSDGGTLLFGATGLSVYDLQTRQLTTLGAPAIAGNDAISNVAVNPVQPDELVIATFERTIYRSTDGGQSWQAIATNGSG